MRARGLIRLGVLAALAVAGGNAARADTLTNPDDPRSWQGATVGTFAQLYFGANTAATRQMVIDGGMLDDGVFDPAGYVPGALLPTPWALGGVGKGESLDSTGTGSFDYTGTAATAIGAGSAIDNQWIQSSGVVGQTVWDLGFQATKVAVFPTIDHGPLPQESIESTVYLSNDQVTWTLGVVERVWLEGYQPNLGIKWDGFVYAVGTGTGDTFRYASVVHGGPGALINDGDDEINGVMGLRGDFTPPPPPGTGVPLPGVAWAGMALLGGWRGLGGLRRRRS
jgi:hypothetical protein